MNSVKTCYRYSCGHIKLIHSNGRLLIHPDECIRKRGVCDKCRNYEEARKAGRERMGLLVGSDRAEYAADKKRYAALKKKKIDEENAIIKVGDIVTVSDLSSYKQEFRPKLPAKGKIVRIDPYPYFVVEIDGKEFEVYKEMLILT